MKHIITLLLTLIVATTISASDLRTITLTTEPQMHCASCEKKIKNALRFERGIKKIITSIEHQTVTITYDADKINEQQILQALAKAGYSARPLRDGETVKKNNPSTRPNMK